MSIIRQNGTSALDFDQVTKKQLAQLVNRQSAQLRQLERERLMLRTCLLAIVQAPDALRYDTPGKITIDMVAVQKVKDETMLNLHRNGAVMELSAADPQPTPSIEMPTLIVPPGVN